MTGQQMIGTGLLVARLLLAAVFAVAGVGKLADPAGTRDAVRVFGGPARAAAPIALALVLGELAVAAGLVISAAAWWAALGALALLALFSAVIARSLRRGEAPQCHCFGRVHAARAGGGTLARNLLLLAVAAVVVAHGSADADVGASATRWVTRLSAPGWIAVAAAVAFGGVLLAAGWLVTELLRRNGRLIERVDQLEGALGDAGLEIPSDPGDRAAAPRAGEAAPAFALPALDGRRVALADLLAPERRLALVFASPSCHPCRLVLRALAQRAGTDVDPLVVVVGEGRAEAWRALPAELVPATVLVQSEREVADRYGAEVTPTAVLVSPDGTLAAPPAFGASATRELLGLAVAAARPGAAHHPPAVVAGLGAAR